MEKLLSYKEVQEFFGVTKATVNSWVRQGLLKPYRITSKTVRFKESEVLEKLMQSGSGISGKR